MGIGMEIVMLPGFEDMDNGKEFSSKQIRQFHSARENDWKR